MEDKAHEQSWLSDWARGTGHLFFWPYLSLGSFLSVLLMPLPVRVSGKFMSFKINYPTNLEYVRST